MKETQLYIEGKKNKKREINKDDWRKNKRKREEKSENQTATWKVCEKKKGKSNEREEERNLHVHTVRYSEAPQHCRSAFVTLAVLTEVVHHGNGLSATLRTPPQPSSLPNVPRCLSANLIGRTVEMSCLSNTHAHTPDQPDGNSGMKEKQGTLNKSK